ncbi:MAG TPA: rhomboid family intramembrane serine protease [Kofleriaceae bacterium]|nr:rhomboid family intramembrane serine protease [Kofleriaceae bacterium]
MLIDLLLLSVIALTGYLGAMVLLRLGPGQRVYGGMLVADLACAAFALIARKSGGSASVAGITAAVAIGGATALLVVPPLLRRLGRHALIADRLSVARWLIDIRELLQPGMGAVHERELVDAIRAVRAGDVDAAVAMLRERRARMSSVEGRRQIDERVIMTYLYARRWSDAVAYFETSAAGRIGASPQLVVEMVRAYGEAGDLAAAAGLISRLEGSPVADEPVMVGHLLRARLMFLAFVGRTGAVEAMCAEAGPLAQMPGAARYFWAGIARLNAGDPAGARSSLEEAVRLSGRDVRAREAAQAMLSSLDGVSVAGARTVPVDVATFADRLSAQSAGVPRGPKSKQAPELGGISWRRIPVTTSLIALNLAAFAAMWLVFGSATDVGGLAMAGANLKPAVRAGEYWRLVSSMFLHVGVLHIALNMYGLWILGKLCEQMFGSVRLLGIYMLAGLGGSVASVIFGGPQMSAGASGAIFGLLGAATVELALHKAAFPKNWRRALLGNLVFLTVANVGIGFMSPAIDQAAHMGGLLVGCALAAALSPKVAFADRTVVRGMAGFLAVASALAVAYAGFGVATTRYSDTLARHGRATRVIGDLTVEVPDLWRPLSAHGLQGESGMVSLYLQRVVTDVALGDAIAARVAHERQSGADELGAGEIDVATGIDLALPAPWQSHELIAKVPAMSGSATFRISIFGRRAGNELWLGTAVFPATLAGDLEAAIGHALTSATPRP